MNADPTRLLSAERIYTSFKPKRISESLLLHGGRVLAVGTVSQMEGLAKSLNQDFEREHLAAIVLPGLTDAHLHLEQYSRSLKIVDCETPTLKECLQRLQKRAASTPAGDWVLGHGWDQSQWDEPISAGLLDQWIPDHPIYVTAKSLHAGVANSLAMQRAKIQSSTGDPPGGKIGRSPTGNLSGMVYENAMRLITASIPQLDAQSLAQDFIAVQDALWRSGLTGVHDFDGARCFAALQILREQGNLGLRVLKNIPVDLLEQAIGLGLRSGFGDEWIKIGNIKVFSDGALGPRTAAMIDPYLDDGENRGMLLVDQEELFDIGIRAVSSGLGLTVHAIGDRANHEVFQAFSRLRKYEAEQDLNPLRHRVEHLQLLHPHDLGECARLNLIASMQPIHAPSDMDLADRYWGERAAFAYAWQSQLEAGSTLAFGSDAPVESPNPFWGIHAAVTRQRHDGTPGEDGWYREQRINVLQAFQAYTFGPAYTANSVSRQGHLEAGANADLIAISRDPFEIPVEQLKDLRPAGTMVAGSWRFKGF